MLLAEGAAVGEHAVGPATRTHRGEDWNRAAHGNAFMCKDLARVAWVLSRELFLLSSLLPPK